MSVTGWHVAVALTSGLIFLWLLVAAGVWLARRGDPDASSLADALRLIPDLIRLIHGLAVDRDLPRGVRVRLWLLLGYLAMPIDVIPDFIPVIGYADDAIVVAFALRSVVRAAGPEALLRHWPGTPAGLEMVKRLAGLSAPTP